MQKSRSSQASLDEFRLTSRSEIESMLELMETSRSLITMSTPDGQNFTTLLWGMDGQRGQIFFSGDGSDLALRNLLESDEIVAVAYLDRIKVQFDVEELVQVKGPQRDVLSARLPDEVFRFQRRCAFRVEPLSQHAPSATFRHPAMPDMKVKLRVLDVSLSGVALFLPENIPAIEAGVQINDTQLQLDGDTSLQVDLLIHYRTALHPDTHGARLGCEFVRADGHDRTLQHYINQTQKRRILLTG
jgi:c-di-GMP-binding flagellar brake protein YcgR